MHSGHAFENLLNMNVCLSSSADDIDAYQIDYNEQSQFTTFAYPFVALLVLYVSVSNIFSRVRTLPVISQ